MAVIGGLTEKSVADNLSKINSITYTEVISGSHTYYSFPITAN